jgi:hypothetical protein
VCRIFLVLGLMWSCYISCYSVKTTCLIINFFMRRVKCMNWAHNVEIMSCLCLHPWNSWKQLNDFLYLGPMQSSVGCLYLDTTRTSRRHHRKIIVFLKHLHIKRLITNIEYRYRQGIHRSGGSSVSIVTRLPVGRPRFSSRRGQLWYFSHRHRVQTGSGAHPASFPIGTGCSYTGSKSAAALGWPVTSLKYGAQECVEL